MAWIDSKTNFLTANPKKKNFCVSQTFSGGVVWPCKLNAVAPDMQSLISTDSVSRELFFEKDKEYCTIGSTLPFLVCGQIVLTTQCGLILEKKIQFSL